MPGIKRLGGFNLNSWNEVQAWSRCAWCAQNFQLAAGSIRILADENFILNSNLFGKTSDSLLSIRNKGVSSVSLAPSACSRLKLIATQICRLYCFFQFTGESNFVSKLRIIYYIYKSDDVIHPVAIQLKWSSYFCRSETPN